VHTISGCSPWNKFAKLPRIEVPKSDLVHGIRLSSEEIRQIRRMYTEGTATKEELARRFGTSESTIYRIVRREDTVASNESADGENTYDACYGVTIAYAHASVLFPEDGYGAEDLVFKIIFFCTASFTGHPAGTTSTGSLIAYRVTRRTSTPTPSSSKSMPATVWDLWAVADPDNPTTHRYYLIGFNGDVWARTTSICWAEGFNDFFPVIENGRPGYIGGTISTLSSGDGSFGDSTEWTFTADSSFDGKAAVISRILDGNSAGEHEGSGSVETDSAGNVTLTFNDIAQDTLASDSAGQLVEPDVWYWHAVKIETVENRRVTIESGRMVFLKEGVGAPDAA
jgi:hypothetical protein